MSKQFWLALAVIAIILGGIVVVNNHNKPTASTASGTPTHHVKGSSPENVALVEYGDYECPVCASFEPTVQQVVSKYSDRVVFQFRNLPLVSIHQNAFAAARAAEAAALQNRFWEMHDLLYQTQNSWIHLSDPQQTFDGYAQQLGLTVTKFDADYASETVNNAINADLNAFTKTGDELATPTFYLDGKKLDNLSLIDAGNRPSVDAFSKFIDAELAKNARH